MQNIVKALFNMCIYQADHATSVILENTENVTKTHHLLKSRSLLAVVYGGQKGQNV